MNDKKALAVMRAIPHYVTIRRKLRIQRSVILYKKLSCTINADLQLSFYKGKFHNTSYERIGSFFIESIVE